MNLSDYDGKCVRITDAAGNVYDGYCEFDSAEYCEHAFGRRRGASGGAGSYRRVGRRRKVKWRGQPRSNGGIKMEEQVITVTIRTKGEKCQMSDAEIKEWYEKNIARLFDPAYGTPEIEAEVRRTEM